jgi:hypothetical protein
LKRNWNQSLNRIDVKRFGMQSMTHGYLWRKRRKRRRRRREEHWKRKC